jgi:Domain of unknown function (DUF4249)
MKLNWNSILLIFSLIGLSSCEKELDASFIESEKQLVVQGFICPQDTLIQITLANSRVLGEKIYSTYLPITNARVTISDSQKSVQLFLLKTTKADSLGKWSRYGVSSKSFMVESGKTYKLSVSNNGFPDIYAQCTVPNVVVDEKNINLVFENELYNGENYKNLNVSWKDFDNDNNYYSWNVISNVNVEQNGKSQWYGYRYSTYYQADTYKNGQILLGQSRIRIGGSNLPFTNKSYVDIYLCNTDKTYFDYNVSILRQQENRGAAIAEPIALRGNIQGGLGVFAAYNLTKLRKSL